MRKAYIARLEYAQNTLFEKNQKKNFKSIIFSIVLAK